jgi:hypothetical protein
MLAVWASQQQGSSGIGPGGISAATWKIISRDVNGGGFTTGSEMKWLDKDGNQISTVGAVHTGSANQSGTPDLLFNGNLGDFWQSGVVNNCFVQTVFPGNVAVAGISWLPLGGFPTRVPIFADIYYNIGAGDVYAFSAVFSPVDNTALVAMDPGPGAQTDWLIVGLTINGSAWFQSELEFRGSLGGADLTGGGTGLTSQNVAASGFSSANLIDNNLATITGATVFRPYDYMGARLTIAASPPQAAIVSRAGFQASQSVLSGLIMAGANRGFRQRATFAGLTWPADPTTNLIAVP